MSFEEEPEQQPSMTNPSSYIYNRSISSSTEDKVEFRDFKKVAKLLIITYWCASMILISVIFGPILVVITFNWLNSDSPYQHSVDNDIIILYSIPFIICGVIFGVINTIITIIAYNPYQRNKGTINATKSYKRAVSITPIIFICLSIFIAILLFSDSTLGGALAIVAGSPTLVFLFGNLVISRLLAGIYMKVFHN